MIFSPTSFSANDQRSGYVLALSNAKTLQIREEEDFLACVILWMTQTKKGAYTCWARSQIETTTTNLYPAYLWNDFHTLVQVCFHNTYSRPWPTPITGLQNQLSEKVSDGYLYFNILQRHSSFNFRVQPGNFGFNATPILIQPKYGTRHWSGRDKPLVRDMPSARGV